MITSFEALGQYVLQGSPKRVAVAAAEDLQLLQAIGRAEAEKLARFILVGDETKLRPLLESIGLDLSIVSSTDPAARSVQLVREGEADLLMKGKVSTGTLLKAVLDRSTGLRKGSRLNHIAAIQSPHYPKLLFISDGGINLQLDQETMIELVHNNVDYLHRLGIDQPKIGMMSLVEGVDPRIPETELAHSVVSSLGSMYLIEGPIAPDVALSKEAAARKGLDSKIAGDVDLFMMPNTTAANHLVKGLSLLGGCKVGGVIVGARVPIILLSRSDDADTRYRSILLGLI